MRSFHAFLKSLFGVCFQSSEQERSAKRHVSGGLGYVQGGAESYADGCDADDGNRHHESASRKSNHDGFEDSPMHADKSSKNKLTGMPPDSPLTDQLRHHGKNNPKIHAQKIQRGN
jgi:hypothetical protein